MVPAAVALIEPLCVTAENIIDCPVTKPVTAVNVNRLVETVVATNVGVCVTEVNTIDSPIFKSELFAKTIELELVEVDTVVELDVTILPVAVAVGDV